MRTLFAALSLWALLHLSGCSGLVTTARGGPCAVEASIECQVERSSRVP
ncbi:hypothetical protein [Ramlibacter alkalitolerans]|uniref:Lipoprotein n=1 Tax=Ramlibacter alkalitolerans TaxID=2039631 RepID=A0ABS1JGZ3_9BURK|nr:hypothetical protein [Ramlibacter alkalitolerans]